MSRIYTQLECGCLISCDNGGGLIPCENYIVCQSFRYIKEHKSCNFCGDCIICYSHSYECTEYDLGGLNK